MEFFTHSNYNFIKYRFHFVVLSAILMMAGIGFYVARGGFNLGIDFAGGANVVLRFQEAPPISELRSIVNDATIQRYGPDDDNAVLIRLPQQDIEGDYAGQIVQQLHDSLNAEAESERLDLNFQGTDVLAEMLTDKNPANRGSDAASFYRTLAERIVDHRSEVELYTDYAQLSEVEGVSGVVFETLRENTYLGAFNVLSQETVGPQVGRELQRKAFWAIFLSTMAMGAYIAVRFDLKFAVAAIICLAHDVALVLAFLLVINGAFEILTVAALLMVVGYSVNDTVVVYDRVRENVRKMRGKFELGKVLNDSMNQTLSRTLLTSGSTMIILVCLILWGGQVINEFAWLLFIGIVVGTYSSLAIAPTVVLAWDRYLTRKQGMFSSTKRISDERRQPVNGEARPSAR